MLYEVITSRFTGEQEFTNQALIDAGVEIVTNHELADFDGRQVALACVFTGRRLASESIRNTPEVTTCSPAARPSRTAILAPEGTRLPENAPDGVALVTDPNPRRALARMAARFYEAQPATIAVTTADGCHWAAASADAWIHVTSYNFV